MESAPSRTIHHESDLGCWELILRDPQPQLRPFVSVFEGYTESETALSRRLEVPGTTVVMIINLGPPYRVLGPGNRAADKEFGSFIGGLIDSYVIVESTGLSRGMQVNFTPIGAHLFFQRSMSELVNLTVRLEDALGAVGERLVAQLDDTPDWDTRFTVLESFIERRIAEAPAPSPAVAFALDRISATRGRVNIGSLASETGWSRKHLASLFREQVGLPPKTVARIERFRHAVRLLGAGPGARLAEVALRCGYYDQAHFNRDFRAFTGATPQEYAARIIPEGGVVGDEFPVAAR